MFSNLITPLTQAALVVLLWLLTHLAATHKAIRIVGTVMDGGTPRWRSAVGLITQLGVLPVLFIVALISNGDAQGFNGLFIQMGVFYILFL